MNITISPCVPDDTAIIYEFNKDLIDLYEDKDTIDYPSVLNWVRKNLKQNSGYYHRVFADGCFAGYIGIIPAQTYSELDSFFILPEFQNQGIGSQLLRYCQIAYPLPLRLYVFQKNQRAISLYLRMGFQIKNATGNTRYIMEYRNPDC